MGWRELAEFCYEYGFCCCLAVKKGSLWVYIYNTYNTDLHCYVCKAVESDDLTEEILLGHILRLTFC
jgi:hypothetical protein